MANKKLIALEQLQTLTRKLYEKLHGEVGTVAAAAQKNLSDISAVSTRVTTAEGKLDTIQGQGEGSIAKALQDAKDYADGQDETLHTTITGEVNGVKSALQANIDKKADAKAMEDALALKAAQADLTADILSATFTKLPCSSLPTAVSNASISDSAVPTLVSRPATVALVA